MTCRVQGATMGSWSYKGSDGFFLVGRVVIRFWCPDAASFLSHRVKEGLLRRVNCRTSECNPSALSDKQSLSPSVGTSRAIAS